MEAPPPPPEPPTLLRSLGQFFGHIVDGIKSDPDAPDAQPSAGPALPDPVPSQAVVVKHEIDERTRHTPQGVVRIRRTIIEEVALEPTDPPPPT